MCLKIYTSLELLLVVLSVITALPASIKPLEAQEDQVISSTSQTNLQVTRVRFLWTIKNLDLSDFVNLQAISSSTFSSGSNDNNSQWNLVLYPKGGTKSTKDYVGVYIHSNAFSNVQASVSFGLIDAKHEETNRKEFLYDFEKGGTQGVHEFVKQDFLMNPENGLLQDGSLTIFCDVRTISTS